MLITKVKEVLLFLSALLSFLFRFRNRKQKTEKEKSNKAEEKDASDDLFRSIDN